MKKDRARERHLLRKYGITTADYEARLRTQGGTCKICRQPPVNNRLSVDHDHRWNKLKITVQKSLTNGFWTAQTIMPLFGVIVDVGKSKQEARETVRQRAMSFSVRGLLCQYCNRGLRFYRDNPQYLANASQYIQEYVNG